MIKPTCPHCGNTSLKLMEDNGLSSGHFDYTLLCIARVKPQDWAFDHEAPSPDQIGKDGKVACSMQWCPIDEEVPA